jgi:hypothetical protein
MKFSLFGIKINMIVILFIVIILILISHTYCGCRNPYALIEGATTQKNSATTATTTPATTTPATTTTVTPATTTSSTPAPASSSSSSSLTSGLSNLVTSAASGFTTFGGAHKEGLSTGTNMLSNLTSLINKSSGKKESFSNIQNEFKNVYAPYSLNNNDTVNTSSWNQPDLVVRPGQPLNPAVKTFLDKPKQHVPLPEGELDLFYSTQFKPECCPNTYSRSNGCACMTGDQYNYLILRGGNNVPYSEY